MRIEDNGKIDYFTSQYSKVKSCFTSKDIVRALLLTLHEKKAQTFIFQGSVIHPEGGFKHYKIMAGLYISSNLMFANIITSVSDDTKFLTEFSFKKMRITDESVGLIRSCGWKFIIIAKFEQNQITARGVKEIVQCNWKSLSYLMLSKNAIKNKGVYWLGKGNWRHLAFLLLSRCSITDESMRILGRLPLHKLIFLDISHNKMGNECLKYITRSNVSNLRYLHIEADNREEVMVSPLTLMKLPTELNAPKVFPSDDPNLNYGASIESVFPYFYHLRFGQ